MNHTSRPRGKEGAVTVDDFHSLALSLPEASESAHMGHPDFRVRGKIFATIWTDEGWGMVKLTPDQQALFVQAEPVAFLPVKGGWGRKGATNVRLEAADPSEMPPLPPRLILPVPGSAG
jgi:hypothetical protein